MEYFTFQEKAILLRALDVYIKKFKHKLDPEKMFTVSVTQTKLHYLLFPYYVSNYITTISGCEDINSVLKCKKDFNEIISIMKEKFNEKDYTI